MAGAGCEEPHRRAPPRRAVRSPSFASDAAPGAPPGGRPLSRGDEPGGRRSRASPSVGVRQKLAGQADRDGELRERGQSTHARGPGADAHVAGGRIDVAVWDDVRPRDRARTRRAGIATGERERWPRGRGRSSSVSAARVDSKTRRLGKPWWRRCSTPAPISGIRHFPRLSSGHLRGGPTSTSSPWRRPVPSSRGKRWTCCGPKSSRWISRAR